MGDDGLICDLLVVGGGVNGAGVARDAAGRGLSVLLCDQDDLAGHTSSASTKLVHGGLRYLEYYEFGLVRKALQEREVLLRAAPHITRPMRFVMPHVRGLRPAWLMRAGLFLYDHLGKRELLPGSGALDLLHDVAGACIQPHLKKALIYSDGWVEDSRLVVLNAQDAFERGAEVCPRTRLVSAERRSGHWVACLQSTVDESRRWVRARCIVNAGGPWVSQVLAALQQSSMERLRMAKGSHILVSRMFEHEQAYVLQNSDRRIIFVIPYEHDYTLIGTTDIEYEGDPAAVSVSTEEVEYLCEIVNRYFVRAIGPDDVKWSYAGVRPLLKDEAASVSAITRDYRLELDAPEGEAPLLSIFGGKITTYRRLAEEAIAMLQPCLGNREGPWTASIPLPGGDIPNANFALFEKTLQRRYPWLPRRLCSRYAHAYGTRVGRLLNGARELAELGQHFGEDLYEAEVAYLVRYEWAMTVEDILWRRSKLGLHLEPATVQRLEDYLAAGNASHRHSTGTEVSGRKGSGDGGGRRRAYTRPLSAGGAGGGGRGGAKPESGSMAFMPGRFHLCVEDA